MFCKVNIMLFSSLLNIITSSLGRWTGGSVSKCSVIGWSVVAGSVVGGFNKSLALLLQSMCAKRINNSYLTS